MPRKPRSDPPSLRVVPPLPVRTGGPEAPNYLSPAMKAWWAVVVADYDLDDHHWRLLEAACASWDRMVQARDAIAEHGLTFEDHNGAPKARPEVAIERDAKTSFARLLRELDLDIDPPPEPRGRPPGLRSNRR
jgi:P27 family predicted phage terminase small subunit